MRWKAVVVGMVAHAFSGARRFGSEHWLGLRDCLDNLWTEGCRSSPLEISMNMPSAFV